MRVLLILILSFLYFTASANSLFFNTRDIGGGTYANITELLLSVSDRSVKMISVEFKGRSGLVTSEKWQKRFQDQDFSHCAELPCVLSTMILPLSLEPLTCEIHVSLTKANGETSNQTQSWGKCKTPPPVIPDRFLPDLALSPDSMSLGNVIVQNDGASLHEKSLKVLAYLEDSERNIIWKSLEEKSLSLSSDEQSSFKFDAHIKTWHEKLACMAFIVIDSDFSIQERKKKNNELQFAYGDCEKVPSVQRGDAYDFRPSVASDDGFLAYKVSNDGRLAMLSDHERLEFDVRYLDAIGNEVISRKLTLKSPLFGFGDSSTVLKEVMPEEACKVRVTVNANYILTESNYLNNTIEMNFCNN